MNLTRFRFKNQVLYESLVVVALPAGRSVAERWFVDSTSPSIYIRFLNKYTLYVPNVKCARCGKVFYAKPNWLKIGWGKYCSRNCVFEKQKLGKLVNCFVCNKEVYKSPKALKRSKSGNFFCTKSCQTIWRNGVFVGPNHGNWKGGEKSYRDVLLRAKVSQVCGRCKIHDTRILAVHHLDRNRQNNKVDNLIWLCHNCHYLIHHNQEEDRKFMEALV